MDERATQGPTIAIGSTVWGRVVGRIRQSRHADWQEGEWVEGMLGWQTRMLSDGRTGRAGYAAGLTRVEPALGPPAAALGVLGMPGLTAYCALMDICQPASGETIVVSAAAGTVGSIVCQLAALRGCRVVAIAGGEQKRRHLLDDLNVDVAVDYKAQADLGEAIREACPEGVHAYFDNVGGSVSDAVLSHLARGARVAVVGRVAQLQGSSSRIDRQDVLIAARALLKGFIVYDSEHRFEEVRSTLAGLLACGQLRYFETIHEGLDTAPQALIDVLVGRGIGKHLIRVTEHD
jgi:NADPH-dependent curcumin reductase CurA